MTVIDLTDARARHDVLTRAFFAEPTEARLRRVMSSYREKRLARGDDPAVVAEAVAVVERTLRVTYEPRAS